MESSYQEDTVTHQSMRPPRAAEGRLPSGVVISFSDSALLKITHFTGLTLPCYWVTGRSFSFLVQFPLRPLKAISAPFGKEQNCAANCCPEERKEKTSPIATQQHKSRRKKSTITYDKHIYGTFDVAFTSTSRSLRGKLSTCGYTSWHLVSSFVALGWANQQHRGELLLRFAPKQPRDGGSASVSPFKSLLSTSLGSSFLCKAWSYCCICRKWPQLYGSDPQFVLVRWSPGLCFYKKLPTAHSLLKTETQRRHNFHVLAAANLSARKNIFTLFLEGGVCVF